MVNFMFYYSLKKKIKGKRTKQMVGTKTGCSRALSGALTQPEQLANENPLSKGTDPVLSTPQHTLGRSPGEAAGEGDPGSGSASKPGH